MKSSAWRRARPILAILVSSRGLAQASDPAVGAGETGAAPPAASVVESPPVAFPGTADAFGPPPDEGPLSLKMYGDTLFQVRDRAPVHDTFAAAHLDLFAT